MSKVDDYKLASSQVRQETEEEKAQTDFNNILSSLELKAMQNPITKLIKVKNFKKKVSKKLQKYVDTLQIGEDSIIVDSGHWI